jgi:hypothetical protein
MGSAESNDELSWGEDGKECGEEKGMGRLSSSDGSIITSEAPVLVSPALPSAVPANDSSEIESASMGPGKTKWSRIVSMESADRMLGRDAQMGRPVRERGASLETLTGSDGGVTD